SQSPSPTELNYDVRVVTFNGAGERQSNDVLVHDVSTGQQLQPTIMTLADGRFLVGWTDGTTTTNGKISAQIFDARIAGVTLNGTAGNDHYVGTAFIDRLDGGAGNDRLVGGDGNDVLYAGAGQDTIDGGRGADYVDYARSVTGVGVTVDLVDQSQNKGDAAGDHYLEVENITGTPWDDVLYGTDDVNELNGGDGADILVGRDGGDTLNGGEGFDYASYEDAPAGVFARLNKGEGGSLGPDLNDNDALGDVWISIEGLIGSAFEDHLWGGINDNILIGGGGDDQLSGFGGSDTLEGGVGADLLLGGEGIDYANYAHAQAGVTVYLRNVIQLPGFVHTSFTKGSWVKLICPG
ncbi:calcium-binding protein, partial [Streptomyces albidoflavus]|uniref:calcium-binding protein n=1 Tax=Streptomyces albidoflavus TaxID=1886 RepID=UPI003442A299